MKRHFGKCGDMFGAQTKIRNMLGNILQLELEKKETKYTKFERER